MAGTRASTGTALALAAVTTLFFAWGFITSLIDPLVGAVKGAFTLTDPQVAANPLTAALGAPRYSHLRLRPSQTF